MCIKHTPFPIISTLSQYPEFKLNIHNLYTFDLEKYQSLIVQPPHTIQSPPKTTTFLSFPWIYILFQFFFHHATTFHGSGIIFSSRRNLHSRPHPVICSFDSSVLFADDRHRETSLVAFRKSRLFKPYRSAFRGSRGDGGGGGCVFLRWRDKARLKGG